MEVDGSLSSQFLTGLLMAFGASVTEPVTIKVNGLKSKPYIDLTLQVMESFGRKVTHTNYEYFHLEPQTINYEPQVVYSRRRLERWCFFACCRCYCRKYFCKRIGSFFNAG
ncbi:MAG: hypothetical protein WKG06_34485 [Segetibacter sp.]